jgi:hypothetical protein
MGIKADSGLRAGFGECPLLGVEPPFLPGGSPPPETLLWLFHIYFSARLPGANSGLSQILFLPADERRIRLLLLLALRAHFEAEM